MNIGLIQANLSNIQIRNWCYVTARKTSGTKTILRSFNGSKLSKMCFYRAAGGHANHLRFAGSKPRFRSVSVLKKKAMLVFRSVTVTALKLVTYFPAVHYSCLLLCWQIVRTLWFFELIALLKVWWPALMISVPGGNSVGHIIQSKSDVDRVEIKAVASVFTAITAI
jgi:hypothetical protein